MATPALSIVIPTHKRADILMQTLEHLAKQTIADQLEVIVVSDGPDEDTRNKMQEAMEKMPNVQFFEIMKSQQGVARNRGVQKASAPIVLFLGDDCFLAPNACEKHLQAHAPVSDKRQETRNNIEAKSQKPKAVLGYVTWDPELEITPVMKWLETSGWQFGYPMIAQYAGKALPKHIQSKFTYTINISVPTDVAKAHPFREDLSLYGWEDGMWGQELADASVQLIYEPLAAGLHHHYLDMDDSLKRMETLGESAMTIHKLDPTFNRIPQGWKRIVYVLISMLPTMRGKHAKAFLRGLKK